MTIERKIARFFQLDDAAWMRHANPWSVATRFTVLPFLLLAGWSIELLQWWATLPIALALLWMYINPLIFKAPKSTRNWASKAVLGERVFLNRDKIVLPRQHQTPVHKIANSVAFGGLLLSMWAVYAHQLDWLITGVLFSYFGKVWYLDRMVWLFEDMKKEHPEYARWEY